MGMSWACSSESAEMPAALAEGKPKIDVSRTPSMSMTKSGELQRSAAGRPEMRPQRRAVCTTRKFQRSEEHTSELQSQSNLVCRLLLEKKKKNNITHNAEVH